MCKHIVGNPCYISRCMGISEVSNCKIELQGHSRSLVLVPFDRRQENKIEWSSDKNSEWLIESSKAINVSWTMNFVINGGMDRWMKREKWLAKLYDWGFLQHHCVVIGLQCRLLSCALQIFFCSCSQRSMCKMSLTYDVQRNSQLSGRWCFILWLWRYLGLIVIALRTKCI